MNRRDHVKTSLAAVCVMMCAQLALCQATAAGSGASAADASASLTAYDVVSVKPVRPIDRMMMMGDRQVRVRVGVEGVEDLPDGINGDGVTVASLLRSAYAGWVLPNEDSVTGVPDWARTDHFSVQAKMSPEQLAMLAKLSKDEQQLRRQAMLQALLADRFRLKVHRETRQVPGYELVVAKGGPKMKKAAANNSDSPKVPDGKQFRAFLQQGMSKNGVEEWTGMACSMEELSGSLRHAPGVDRRVVDKTGLMGKYEFTLTFAASPGLVPTTGMGSADAAAPVDSAASIFTALEDQLGLKLQRGIGTVDVVVVDHVERPGQD